MTCKTRAAPAITCRCSPPRKVLTYDIKHTLKDKFASLEEVTGLSLPKLVSRAPALLALNPASLTTRRDTLCEMLPDADVPAMIKCALLRLMCTSMRAVRCAALFAADPGNLSGMAWGVHAMLPHV